MTDKSDASFDSLSDCEGQFCEESIAALSGKDWAEPLLRTLDDAGGITRENKSFLFELRFARALHENGVIPEYEIKGENNSTIDFGFTHDGKQWAVELMRLEETDAAKSATKSTGEFVSRVLSTDATDKKQSEEGETLKAIERICQKCEKNGKPRKFPAPLETCNVILVDMRTLLYGGDEADRIHVALSGKYLKHEFHRRYWRRESTAGEKDRVLITGAFDEDTKLRGATEVRERVHFIGFVNEKAYENGAFGAAIQFVANPNLFKSEDEVEEAIASWPQRCNGSQHQKEAGRLRVRLLIRRA